MDAKAGCFKNCSVKRKGFRVTISDATQSLSALICFIKLVSGCLAEGCQADHRANRKAPGSCCLILLFYFPPYSWEQKRKKKTRGLGEKKNKREKWKKLI